MKILKKKSNIDIESNEISIFNIINIAYDYLSIYYYNLLDIY